MLRRLIRKDREEEDYDVELEEKDENEDDCESMNDHGRIRSYDGRNGRGLVQILRDRGVDRDLGNIKI